MRILIIGLAVGMMSFVGVGYCHGHGHKKAKSHHHKAKTSHKHASKGQEHKKAHSHGKGKAYSHGKGQSHNHKAEITAEESKVIAMKHIHRLMEKSKLEGGWELALHLSSEKKKFGDKMEWVVQYENKAATAEDKKKLYVFLSTGGNFIAANHTGK